MSLIAPALGQKGQTPELIILSWLCALRAYRFLVQTLGTSAPLPPMVLHAGGAVRASGRSASAVPSCKCGMAATSGLRTSSAGCHAFGG